MVGCSTTLSGTSVGRVISSMVMLGLCFQLASKLLIKVLRGIEQDTFIPDDSRRCSMYSLILGNRPRARISTCLFTDRIASTVSYSNRLYALAVDTARSRTKRLRKMGKACARQQRDLFFRFHSLPPSTWLINGLGIQKKDILMVSCDDGIFWNGLKVFGIGNGRNNGIRKLGGGTHI